MIPAYVFQRKYGADYRQGHILPSSNKSVIEKNYELLKPIIRNEFNILAQGQVTWIQLGEFIKANPVMGILVLGQ